MVPGRNVVPDAIGANGHDSATEQDRAGGDPPLAYRHGEAQVVLELLPLDLLLEAAHHLGAIEAQILRIGADEADGVGAAGKILVPPVLDGLQVRRSDTERRTDLADVAAKSLACLAQQRADAMRPLQRRVAEIELVLKFGFVNLIAIESRKKPHFARTSPLSPEAELSWILSAGSPALSRRRNI